MVFSRFRRSQINPEDEQKLDKSLSKTRGGVLGRLGSIFQANEISDDMWDDLEEALIMGDVGVDTTMKLVEATRGRVRNRERQTDK